MSLLTNANERRARYDAALRRVLSMERAGESRRWLAQWPALAPGATPLWRMPALAHSLGVAQISIKDESLRSALGSFKVLGAPIALVRLILRERPDDGYTPASLFAGSHADDMRALTVICATDGNHGRALAAAARDIGCRCVVVLHRHVSEERERAIAHLGAEVVRIGGNYDDSVRVAAEHAARHGWHVVSDTAYDGYEAIPRDAMQGYATIAAEVLEQEAILPDAPCPYTHVVLQGGVGGLAAGVLSYLWEYYQERRPTFVVVEPQQADCLYQSALAGRATHASGSVDSVMAGLACGEASPLAWRFLLPAVRYFATVADDEAVVAMRRLAEGAGGDIPVVSGESGAAGLAGLIALTNSDRLREQAGITPDAHVLLVNTEGASAPALYEQLVGRPVAAVLAQQRDWLAERSPSR